MSCIRKCNNSIRVPLSRSTGDKDRRRYITPSRSAGGPCRRHVLSKPAQATRYGQPSGRTLLVLLLVCLTLLGQSLALASQEESHHGPDHCCLLCHVGPLPFLQTAVSATVMPVFVVAWLLPIPDSELAPSVLLFASSSRGPPAA
jgi:hypothetical protein